LKSVKKKNPTDPVKNDKKVKFETIKELSDSSSPNKAHEQEPYFTPSKLGLDTLVAENVQVRYKFEK
jgi:hypothetical protein